MQIKLKQSFRAMPLTLTAKFGASTSSAAKAPGANPSTDRDASRRAPDGLRKGVDGKDPHLSQLPAPSRRKGYEQSVSGVSLYSEGSGAAVDTSDADGAENPLLQYVNSSDGDEDDGRGGKPVTSATKAIDAVSVYKVRYYT